MQKYVLFYYAAISLLAVFLYAVDKHRAKVHRTRIPEAGLLALGFFGGAVGALLGMRLFRHKTRHLRFWIVNLMGLAWQAWSVYFLYARLDA